MLKKKAGRIINISSVVGQIGNPGQVQLICVCECFSENVCVCAYMHTRVYLHAIVHGLTPNLICSCFLARALFLSGPLSQANYAAAKGGVLGMTKAMAKEFATRGVTGVFESE